MKYLSQKKIFWKLLPFAAKQIDEPVADYAILPTFKLAEKASKDFKVAITGEVEMNFLVDMEDTKTLIIS